MNEKNITPMIDRNTYRSIKKMSREELKRVLAKSAHEAFEYIAEHYMSISPCNM